MWMFVLATSAFWNLWWKERHSLYLQQIVMILPILKTLHTMFITVNIALCYDQLKWETANKYLIMGLISFETLFQTILLTNFLAIAKGWGIVRYYVLREEANHVIIVLGVVYLHFSAFFVTIELHKMNLVVKVSNLMNKTFQYFIALGHLILIYFMARFYQANIKLLNAHHQFVEANNIPFIGTAL